VALFVRVPGRIEGSTFQLTRHGFPFRDRW
jgi:hypothetical protein